MKNKFSLLFKLNSKKLIGFTLSLMILVSILSVGVSAQNNIYTVDDYENLIDGIVTYKMAETNTDSIQELIDSGLSPYAGTITTDWYIVALRQYKNSYDYTAYISALNKYVKNMTNSKATDLQRIAIAYSSAGSNTDFIKSTIDGSIGKLGITSYIYGLILLDCGAYTSTSISRNDIIKSIISLSLSDGGWALSGSTSDIDITAMAVQALAPYYKFNDVKIAVDNALTLLSNRQLENGDYSSWGTRCCESVAQVITALSALNIDCQTDSRFIKNGNTLIDGMLLYKLSDGSFCHSLGGKSNSTASEQAAYSLVSAWRQLKGLGSLYKFTNQTIEREVNNQTESDNSTKSSNAAATQSVASDIITAASETTGTGTESSDTTDTNGIQAETSNTSGTPETTSSYIEGTQTDNSVINYKVWVYGIIIILTLIAIGFLFITKKYTKKNIILVIALTIAALLIVNFTNIQSVDEYYLVHINDIKPDSKTVTISIRCDTVTDKLTEKTDYIPEDGCILKNTEYVLRDGDTVFDLLVRAAKHNKIQLEYEGAQLNSLGTAYVKGINYLYEYDFGDTSGWMYKVNGKFENAGCSDYVLSDGDVIEWVYSCDLGKDVGN